LKNLTVAQEKHWTSKRQLIDSTRCCCDQLNPSPLFFGGITIPALLTYRLPEKTNASADTS
ncbi:hypothetical protein, partial [Varunaivibrio sulfuroxidans]|uniref:hypothetical protein n=1 Tax=Varunaivibrio sulfuroxidans TaxID=1773489 RepID=UPI001A9D2A94